MHESTPKPGRRSRKRVNTRCACRTKLQGFGSEGQIIFEHLESSGVCGDLYAEKNQLFLTDDPRRTLVITASIHARKNGWCWIIIGMGVEGDVIRVSSQNFMRRLEAYNIAEAMRGE